MRGSTVLPGVLNAKKEECTTPYMRQNIKINIGVGGTSILLLLKAIKVPPKNHQRTTFNSNTMIKKLAHLLMA